MTTARVIVVSTRAAAGKRTDETGPQLVSGLADACDQVQGPIVVGDGAPAGAAIAQAISDGMDLVITTGGTGLSPTDRTPEVTRPLLDYEIPGIAEELRRYGAARVPTAVLSRGLAGVAGRALIINLPGSKGAVAEGLAVLTPLLPHMFSQLQGGDH